MAAVVDTRADQEVFYSFLRLNTSITYPLMIEVPSGQEISINHKIFFNKSELCPCVTIMNYIDQMSMTSQKLVQYTMRQQKVLLVK